MSLLIGLAHPALGQLDELPALGQGIQSLDLYLHVLGFPALGQGHMSLDVVGLIYYWFVIADLPALGQGLQALLAGHPPAARHHLGLGLLLLDQLADQGHHVLVVHLALLHHLCHAVDGLQQLLLPLHLLSLVH